MRPLRESRSQSMRAQSVGRRGPRGVGNHRGSAAKRRVALGPQQRRTAGDRRTRVEQGRLEPDEIRIIVAGAVRGRGRTVAEGARIRGTNMQNTRLGEGIRTQLAAADWAGLHRRRKMCSRYSVSVSAAILLVLGCSSSSKTEQSSAAGGSRAVGGHSGSSSGSSGMPGNSASGTSGANSTGGLGGAGGAEEVTYEPFPCGPSSGRFTACVERCGGPATTVAQAAACVGGVYTCPAPLIVAASCPADAWRDSKGCGPWVQAYDCTCPAVCEERLWTCYVDCL